MYGSVMFQKETLLYSEETGHNSIGVSPFLFIYVLFSSFSFLFVRFEGEKEDKNDNQIIIINNNNNNNNTIGLPESASIPQPHS